MDSRPRDRLSSAIEDRRDEVFLATKFGIKLEPGGAGGAPKRSIDGSPAYVREACAGSLDRLSIDHIDPWPGCSVVASTSSRSQAPKRVSYLEENLAASEVELTDEELERIADAIPRAAGERYDEAGMRSVNL